MNDARIRVTKVGRYVGKVNRCLREVAGFSVGGATVPRVCANSVQ